MLSLSLRLLPCFSVRACVRARVRWCVRAGGGACTSLICTPNQAISDRHQDCVASHVCSSRYGRLLCIRTCFPLVPTYRSLAHLFHPDSQTQGGRPKRKEHYRKPGLSRGHPCNLLVPSASAPATLLPHPAAPCCTCTWPSRLHSHLLQPAPCTLHPAPCNPTPPFESRPHVPPVDTTQDPGMHLQVRSPARYRATTVRPVRMLCLDMGQSLAEPAPHR